MKTAQPPQRLAAAGVLSFAFLLVACRDPQAAAAMQSERSLQPVPVDQAGAENGVKDMSALEGVLGIFGRSGGEQWHAYEAAPGVKWRDASPVASEGAQAQAAYKRGGNLLLKGFGTVDVPDGRTGAEAGSRKDNEGNSGITLFGTADRVESLSVMKFYPSQDYAGILRNQLSGGSQIDLFANTCAGPGEEDPESREFYRIRAVEGVDVYAEIYVDTEGGKYSPGSTTFEFYRTQPADRIKSLGCEIVGKD